MKEDLAECRVETEKGIMNLDVSVNKQSGGISWLVPLENRDGEGQLLLNQRFS